MKSGGVSFYARGVVPVEVSFPEGDVCCEFCRLCIKDPSAPWRKICFATGEIIVHIAMTGRACPLRMEEENKGGEENGDHSQR